jgi:hypothetical protein
LTEENCAKCYGVGGCAEVKEEEGRWERKDVNNIRCCAGGREGTYEVVAFVFGRGQL